MPNSPNKTLEEEYIEFRKNNYFGKCFISSLYTHVALLLIIFILPKPHNELTAFTKIFYTNHEKYFSKYRILF